MRIENDLSELNKFVHDEFSSILQVYGIQHMPEKALKSISAGILKRRSIYGKVIQKEDKFRAKIEWAYFTMPHNWLWKFFHKRLWYHVKKRIEEDTQEEPEETEIAEAPQVLPPQLVKSVDLQSMSYPSTMMK